MVSGALRQALRNLRLPACPASWACLSICPTSDRKGSLLTDLFQAQPPALHHLHRFPSFQLVSASTAVAAVNTSVYHVEVVTGDVRGAGSQTGAVVKLIGARGETKEFAIGNDHEDPGFVRGSSQLYAFETDVELGELIRVYVQQMDPSWTDVGSGWFLDRIDVTSPDDSKLSFPCNTWIGKSDAGDFDGGQERNLIPCQIPAAKPAFQERRLTRPLKVTAGAVAWPHPEKLAGGQGKAVNKQSIGWAGEDAYFHATNRRTGIFGLGVADGVYMWRDQGIDAGALARKLTATSQSCIYRGKVDVLSVLQEANDTAMGDGCRGSSTCCIVMVDMFQGRLSSANVGDSGYLVMGCTPQKPQIHVKYRSPQQEHNFGVPYQLGHEDKCDTPADAMLITLPVVPGDVIVLGSDGLWDNLSVDSIIKTVHQLVEEGERPPRIAIDLARGAFQASVDRDAETPYSLAATEAFDMIYSGGKQDDITVVAACIE